MKKPVRKTTAEIEAIASRRVNKQITVTAKIPSGNLYKLQGALDAFIAKYDLADDDVRISNSFYNGSYLYAKVLETDKQKIKRIRDEYEARYLASKYDWDREQQQQAYAAQQAARYAAAVKKSQCCPSNCCCRRS